MKKVLLGMSALLVSAASFANYGLEVKVGVNGGARFKQDVSIREYAENYTGEAKTDAEAGSVSKLMYDYKELIKTYETGKDDVANTKAKFEKEIKEAADETAKKAKEKEQSDYVSANIEKNLALEKKLEDLKEDKDADDKINNKRSYVGSAEVTVYKKLSASEDFDVKVGGGLEGGVVKMKDQKSKFFVSPYVSGEVSKEVKEDIKVFGGVNLGTYHYFGNLKKINVKAEGFVGVSYRDMYNVQLSAGTLKHVSLGVSARLGF